MKDSKRVSFFLNCALILFGLFASSLVTLHSLRVAATKDFWLDEVFEIKAPLAGNLSSIWKKGVEGSPSASPLYFTAQKLVLPTILQRERDTGEGYDWRITYRLVPAFALGLGAFICFLMLFPFDRILAISIPIFLCNLNFALYYGAETRIYSTWLALCLCFFGTRYLLWMRWVIFAALLTLTSISSPLIVLSVAASIFFHALRARKVDRKLNSTLASGIFVSFAIYFYYRVANDHFSLTIVHERMKLWHFQDEGFRVVEGLKNYVLLVFLSVVLIFSPKFFETEKGDFCRYAGLVGLSQLLLLPAIYVLQIGTGYFFAARHGIFVVAAQCLIYSSLLLYAIQFVKFLSKKYELKKVTESSIIAVVLLVCFNNWYLWRIRTIPESLEVLAKQKLKYCHGPVVVDEKTLAITRDDERDVALFNLVNRERHEAHCVSSPQKDLKTADFAPEWIYGQSR